MCVDEYKCVCMCVDEYMSGQTISVCVHMWVGLCVCLCVCICPCIHACVCVCVFVYAYMRVHVSALFRASSDNPVIIPNVKQLN